MPFQCRIRVFSLLLEPLPVTYPPTAQLPLAEVAATPARRAPSPGEVPGPGLGLGTCFQAVPFQCSVRVFVGPMPLPLVPTTQALCGVRAATPVRKTPSGPDTRFQTLPFQCRIRLPPGPHPHVMSPTAQALPAETMATLFRLFRSPAPGLGLGTRFHTLPFQCRITFFARLKVDHANHPVRDDQRDGQF